MKEYLHILKNPLEEDYNIDFIKSKNDYKIEDLIVMAMMEVEAISNITIEGYGVNYDIDKIDINEHKVNINYKRKDPYDVKIPKYRYICDSVYAEMWFRIKVETNLNCKVITKKILVPILTDDGYYIINNKKAKAIWQMAEASVYTQRGKITLKSRMPIIMYKSQNKQIKDVDGNMYNFRPYSYAMDMNSRKKKSAYAAKGASKTKNKFINPFIIFAAKMGLIGAIQFMTIDKYVSVVQRVYEDQKEDFVFFPMSTLYLRVAKTYLENDMIMSLVGMLVMIATDEFPLTWDNMNDPTYWICRIGLVGSKHDRPLNEFYNKGITTIMMIERLLDAMTIQNLRLPESHKENIYTILRWMVVQFDDLKYKDNIDINNKRVRKTEYIIRATLGRKINDNINRVIAHRSDSRANNMETLLEVFNFGGDIILNGMRNINDLIKTDDFTNDLSLIEDLAYSSKGPESLGDGSSKNIMTRMRDVHPSFIGKLDPECTSNSDVGMSGSFVPYVKIYDNFYFTPEREPCYKLFEINSTIKPIDMGDEATPDTVINFSTGEILDLPKLDCTSQDAFNDSLKIRNDSFGINYEKITIVEHENTPSDKSDENEKDE